MHPYLPFAALPIAFAAAWFAAANWSSAEPGRYRIPPVTQIEDPSVPLPRHSDAAEKTDIRVSAFLPRARSRAPAPPPVLILNSVMTGADVYLASINNQLVKAGDELEGYLVNRITADGVELTRAGKTRWLPMRPLHELPPPSPPGLDSAPQTASVGDKEPNLASNFWATFEAPQP
jgi:hypothetical protein